MHLGKPDTLCHMKRVRREAKGFSQMRANPRFILILLLSFLDSLKDTEESLPNRKESQQLSKSSRTGLLSAWLDLWQLPWRAPLELGSPAAPWAAWPAGHWAPGGWWPPAGHPYAFRACEGHYKVWVGCWLFFSPPIINFRGSKHFVTWRVVSAEGSWELVGSSLPEEGVQHCPSHCSEALEVSGTQSQVLQGRSCCIRNFFMVSAVAFGGNNLITLFFRSICGRGTSCNRADSSAG